MKKTMKEQRMKRHRKTKKNHIQRTSNFDLTRPHFWTSLIGIQPPPPPPPLTLGNFGSFLENFKNEINIVTHSFFLANAHSIYYSHMYHKTDRKVNSFSPSRLLRKADVSLVFPL